MKSKTILFSIFLMLIVGLSSCSKDDSSDKKVDNTTAGCSAFTTDYQEVSAATTAFYENPTTANCEAYKTAWLNFFESYHDCPYWEEGDYQSAIDAVNEMDCSDL